MAARRPPSTPGAHRIETLLLDADGVVQTSGANLISSIETLCPEPSQRVTFLQDVFLAEKRCLTGLASFPDALARVLTKWQIRVPLTEALNLWHQIDPVPEVLAAVTRLRERGVRVCLATNQQAHRAAIMTDRLGYAALFDDLFFSHQLGVAKPASRHLAPSLRVLNYS